MADLISPTGKPLFLPPVRPNVGIQVAHQDRADALISEMQADIVAELTRIYRYKPPKLAADASPAMALREAMRGLGKRWQTRFDEAAPELAAYFATANKDRADGAMMDILRRAGYAIKFRMTPTMNDAYQAVIGENVGLIKSIASEHLTEVEGLVMRSVQAGGSLGFLTRELQARYEITRRRAALIARDQNNKATSTMVRVRQQELGITKAKWLHSAGGRKPRPAHVAFSGQLYDVRTGAFIDGEWIRPGEKINCRCVSVSVIPGF